MYDRRSNRRFNVHERVELDIRKGSFLRASREFLRASVEDIGRGGMQVLTDRRIDAGSRLIFSLNSSFLPEPLEGDGRVRYVMPVERAGGRAYTVGVKFTRVSRSAVCRFLGKINGWRRSARLCAALRNELSVLAKLIPLLLVAAWFISRVSLYADRARLMDEAYAGRLKEAVIYALYHMD
ncbi:MAG: PilZ domain-containing protein [Candidatus Omnitrophica bacterium]|nr:PilZ domain-containing protein [Candidatus Omnitrophota bacterium]